MGILKDKLYITAEIELVTGMHIGSSSDFAPIGAVDSVVVRDPLTNLPIIPGSSLKGKLRSLLAKELNDNVKNHNNDKSEIKRLFGSSCNEMFQSRLQFFDLKLQNKNDFNGKTDLVAAEIKFENVINRTSGKAEHPRQTERVPAGAKFNLQLIYNYENDELNSDFDNIAKAFKLLQLDYIGGSGSRGYGKLKITNFKVEAKLNNTKTDDLKNKLEAVKNVLSL